jgi:hypothetical protein
MIKETLDYREGAVPGRDIEWGGKAIGHAINRNPRQTYHLLETGRLPAKKIGGRWCASRAVLRAFLTGSTDQGWPESSSPAPDNPKA